MTRLPSPPRPPKMPGPITDHLISAKVPTAVIYDLGQLQKRWGMNRSAVVRKLLEDGICRESQP